MKRNLFLLFAALLTTNIILAQGTVEIKFNGNSATVSVPDTVSGVFHSISGANVIINSTTTDKEYTYVVSGQSDDGSLTIYGQYKMTMQLDGITLTNNHNGGAIDIECGKRIKVQLKEGKVNTLVDAPTGGQKAAFYLKGHAEFSGAGTLNVTGRLKHAISAKEYIEIKPSTGIINILGAVSDGIHCGKGKVGEPYNYFLMRGGVVNIMQAGSDGIDSDDFGTVNIIDGAVSINVGDGGTGIEADSILTISGGKINIAVDGQDANGLRSRYQTNIKDGTIDIMVTGNGSKGFKSKRNEQTDATATVKNGGYFNISGGNIDIKTMGDYYITTVDEVNDTSKCMGMSIDKDLKQTGGDITLTAMGKEAMTHNVKGTTTRDGGTFATWLYPWKLNGNNYQYDMTVYATIQNADLNKYTLGAFCGEECRGLARLVSINTSASVYMLRLYSNQATGETITFKCINKNDKDGNEIPLIGTVAFQSQTVSGEPGNPVILKLESTGIDAMLNGNTDMTNGKTIFDLQGRKAASQPAKGLYLIRTDKGVRKVIR